MNTSQSGKRKQVLSAIQPTGNLHLGRYFGAIQNWVRLQEEYDCVYGIVDYHAMTMPYDPHQLREQVWNLAFDLIAVGVEPDNMFIQSLIPEHTELAWIFNCVSSYGEVSRMTQFKDKSQQINDKSKDAFISTGLFTYPVLQAADILIYQADYVPVGKDQEQHLELSRNIAQRFNQVVGKEYFVLPEILFADFPKVMSTADPTKKMSASLGPKHHINVFSPPDVIRKQIKSAVTDSGLIVVDDTTAIFPTPQLEGVNAMGKKVQVYTSQGIVNLFQLLEASGGENEAAEFFTQLDSGTLQYGKLKEAVADKVIALTEPFREKRQAISEDKKSYQDRVIEASARIRQQAQKTLHEVKDLVGLMNIQS